MGQRWRSRWATWCKTRAEEAKPTLHHPCITRLPRAAGGEDLYTASWSCHVQENSPFPWRKGGDWSRASHRGRPASSGRCAPASSFSAPQRRRAACPRASRCLHQTILLPNLFKTFQWRMFHCHIPKRNGEIPIVVKYRTQQLRVRCRTFLGLMMHFHWVCVIHPHLR